MPLGSDQFLKPLILNLNLSLPLLPGEALAELLSFLVDLLAGLQAFLFLLTLILLPILLFFLAVLLKLWQSLLNVVLLKALIIQLLGAFLGQLIESLLLLLKLLLLDRIRRLFLLPLSAQSQVPLHLQRSLSELIFLAISLTPLFFLLANPHSLSPVPRRTNASGHVVEASSSVGVKDASACSRRELALASLSGENYLVEHCRAVDQQGRLHRSLRL